MSKSTALVTGAGGEMGHGIVPILKQRGFDIVALDLRDLPQALALQCAETIRASLLDRERLREALERHQPEMVFHLAAVLSAKAEEKPELAHEVNVDGTVGLIDLCREAARGNGRNVRFLYPSSIAIYGLPDAAAKQAAGAVREEEWNFPRGMYGCNKLYGEMMGRYWTERARGLGEPGIDFRSVRFPGLISADTLPTGGTTDYGPEMIHAAVLGKPYTCFVRPDTRLPFMTMPDAVDAFFRLALAPPEGLSTRVYNIGAFSPTASELRDAVLEHYPEARIAFDPVPARQAIVDSWPGDVDDTRARRDWGHSPQHGLSEAMRDYLLPALRRLHGTRANP